MSTLRRRLLGGDGHQYALIGRQEASPTLWTRKHSILTVFLLAFGSIVVIIISSMPSPPMQCDSVNDGYQCSPELSHYWGQYSPYFCVESEVSPAIPDDCEITFAQILSRHGARDPTFGKSILYKALFTKIKANVREYKGKYAFLADYEYNLGHDQLSVFGQQELVNSGIKFYNRYPMLSRELVPFVRASGQKRVIDSALNWTQGFQDAKVEDPNARHDENAYPGVDLVISEASGMNNTLSHDLCTQFEDGPGSGLAHDAQRQWASIFIPDIQRRINEDLVGANLSVSETTFLMDLCPFDTVASPSGKLSPFCNLFTKREWEAYNYFETLDKWYGYSHGNPLGPTQGVGYVNELIARLTGQAVQDHTNTNHTLDDNPETFPLDRKLYADFSHDNDMVSILAAFRFYNETAQLPNTTIVDAQRAGGFSAAWTVPFAARVYFEKMKCSNHQEELVRVLVNDRVLPLTQCSGDGFGRCSLAAFVESLQFARGGGLWDACFVGKLD